MNLRKVSATDTLLDEHIFLLYSEFYPYTHRQVKLLPPVKEVSLYRK